MKAAEPQDKVPRQTLYLNLSGKERGVIALWLIPGLPDRQERHCLSWNDLTCSTHAPEADCHEERLAGLGGVGREQPELQHGVVGDDLVTELRRGPAGEKHGVSFRSTPPVSGDIKHGWTECGPLLTCRSCSGCSRSPPSVALTGQVVASPILQPFIGATSFTRCIDSPFDHDGGSSFGGIPGPLSIGFECPTPPSSV
eukprot:SAG22_NODE_104_length_20159_cov_5.877517_20_plen_198_part_00